MRFFYISDDKDVDATVISVTLKSKPNPELVFKGDKILLLIASAVPLKRISTCKS